MWKWVLAVLLALLILLCLTRVGVYAAFGGNGLALDVCLGPLRLRVLPAREGKEKKKKPPKEKSGEKKEEKKEKKGLPPIAWEDVKDALRVMLPALRRALGRTRRGIRIHPLRLSLTLGGREDPAAAAENYGRLQTAVWTGMPLLESLLDIPQPAIHSGVDFDAGATAAEGEVGVAFRIGTLLALAFGLAFPALGWLWRFWRRSRRRARAAKRTAQAEPVKEEEKAA